MASAPQLCRIMSMVGPNVEASKNAGHGRHFEEYLSLTWYLQ